MRTTTKHILAACVAGAALTADVAANDSTPLRNPAWKDFGFAAYLPRVDADVPWLRVPPRPWPRLDLLNDAANDAAFALSPGSAWSWQASHSAVEAGQQRSAGM
jgi:hypothetical protein